MRKKKEEKDEILSVDDDKIEVVTVKKEGFNYPEMIVIMVIAILFGFFIGNVVSFTRKTLENNNVPKDLKELVATYNDIVDNYYEDVDKEKLVDAGIKGMVDYLDDPYASYYEGSASDTFNETLEGVYEGIGIEVKYENEKVVVNKVFDDTPSSKAGIKENDILLKVNGESTEGKTLTDVVQLIQTSKDKTIKLTLLRDEKELEVKVTREKIDTPLVTGKVYEENNKKVGYLKIDIFSANISKQFKKELTKLEKEKINSLIIDVRDNPGGYLGQVTDILSLFMTKKQVIYQLQTKGEKEKFYGTSKKATYQYPVVVLINNDSASASEILASSFKETYGADVVGEKSYGKGTVQKTGDLENGDTFKYTVQKWLTPKGHSIDKEGVEPTIEVKLELGENEALTEENDVQLKKAIEVASTK